LIPPDNVRKVGEVQWPTAATLISKRRFDEELTKTATLMYRDRVLIFVHDFDNRFNEAVFRLAQIVYGSSKIKSKYLF